MTEPIRLDRYRERVEVDAPEPRSLIGRGLQPVYLIGLDKREALAWAQRNKPGFVPKFCHAYSTTVMRGLYLRDVPVYVLCPVPQDVRECWAVTKANLVYL